MHFSSTVSTTLSFVSEGLRWNDIARGGGFLSWLWCALFCFFLLLLPDWSVVPRVPLPHAQRYSSPATVQPQPGLWPPSHSPPTWALRALGLTRPLRQPGSLRTPANQPQLACALEDCSRRLPDTCTKRSRSYTVLVSSGCYNRIHRLGALNSKHLFFPALEAGSLRSGCLRGQILSEVLPPSLWVSSLLAEKRKRGKKN